MSAPPPFKMYIQDVYRAKRTENKYVYELFSTRLKNVSLHGAVTQIHSVVDSIINFELTDPTGSVHVFYNWRKSDHSINSKKLKSICDEFEDLLLTGHTHLPVLRSMKDAILQTQQDQIDLKVGSYVHIVGDIFADASRGVRMVSAFECNTTSPQREIVWLKELYYLYDKFYLWSKVDDDGTGKQNGEIKDDFEV